MSSTHTKGPWTVNRHPHSADVQYHDISGKADDGRMVIIADIYPISDDGQPGGESEANARLIAKAPQMLDALKRCRAGTITWAEVDAIIGEAGQ